MYFQQAEVAPSHSRCIIHLDVDCFYAQVEMISEPSLTDKPLGIQQKNIVVTCNYVARARGVGKCMYISEAVKVCPDLVLVNGEDLARYRRVSMGVYNTLVRETGCEVERLGMDENWVDVTRLVEEKVRQEQGQWEKEVAQHRLENLVGLECSERCDCRARLLVGAVIARQLREKIFSEHRLTVSAGISYNKLLSKLCGGLNKPNNQTVLGPAGLAFVLSEEMKVTDIPGLGRRTQELLETEGVRTVGDLRRAELCQVLRAGLGEKEARSAKELCWGRDSSQVKMSGRVGSIGLEDRFKGIQDKAGVKQKIVWLLGRLETLLAEDGRQPTTMKVTLRDYHKDKQLRKFHKESRQCKVSPRLFLLEAGGLKSSSMQELTDTAISLVGKMVRFSQTFHLTLLGLALTDFLEPKESNKSIKRFFSPTKLQKKKEEKISDPTPSTENEVEEGKVPTLNSYTVEDERKNKRKPFFTDVRQPKAQKVETNTLPRPKDIDQDVWNSLPSNVQEEILQETAQTQTSSSPASPQAQPSTSSASPSCPGDIDPEVFSQLPSDIQQELIESRKRKHKLPAMAKKTTNTIKNYFSVR